MAQSVGTVAELWRFPVKSMAGERLEAAELTTGGIVGDRAYALTDAETGNVVSAKSVRLFPGILNCRARFLEPPQAGRPAPPVRIDLPDGQSATSDGDEAERALSALFGRAVRLASSAPEDFTIDMQVADVEGADPQGRRGQTLQQKIGAAVYTQAGAPSPVAATAFFDLFPLSVITRATLRRLEALQPQSRFDARRFRMNVVVETQDEGFVENDWLGKPLSIGAGAAARITIPDPRCVMTTLPQDDLEQDNGILSALVEHNRLQLGEGPRYPCAGVYAVVTTPGPIRTGDAVGLG
jgi:uncharacterized protein YcbX